MSAPVELRAMTCLPIAQRLRAPFLQHGRIAVTPRHSATLVPARRLLWPYAKARCRGTLFGSRHRGGGGETLLAWPEEHGREISGTAVCGRAHTAVFRGSTSTLSALHGEGDIRHARAGVAGTAWSEHRSARTPGLDRASRTCAATRGARAGPRYRALTRTSFLRRAGAAPVGGPAPRWL